MVLDQEKQTTSTRVLTRFSDAVGLVGSCSTSSGPSFRVRKTEIVLLPAFTPYRYL